MAVTTEKSSQLARIESTPPKVNPTHHWHGRERFYEANFTQGAAAGDAGSIARLLTLPAGKVRLVLWKSRIATSAFGVARTLDLGWEAYTKDDGSAVAASPNGLDAGQDVAAAGAYTPIGTLGAGETMLFESKGGVTLTARVNAGTIPAAATIDGGFTVVVD